MAEQIANLTADLQRIRADFENYRKHTDDNLAAATARGEQKAIAKILPILDIFDNIFANLTDEIRETGFGQGIILAEKNLAKTCAELKLQKIAVKIGDEFDHEFMHAVQFDENSTGEKEVVAEILQSGYVYNGEILRSAMVKVARE
jgi:molecular chaperone GrpE